MAEDGGLIVSAEQRNPFDAVAGNLCPVYFGASCAFLALQLLPKARGPDLDDARRCRLRETLLQGSARLLGLLIWRSQKAGEALGDGHREKELEVAEVKRLRAEDARANEKVAAIFACRERSWIAEKKKLQAKTQALEEEMGQLRAAEAAAEETRERARKEVQDHETELLKHKTAFAELVSSHRQLEAEMGRALCQVEAARRELDEVFEQKEAALLVVEKLSSDLARVEKETEQKGKVLSAMLRKCKLDVTEKQALLEEVRTSKAREKQMEAELQRLRDSYEIRRRQGARPPPPQAIEAESSHDGSGRFHHRRALLIDYLQAESTENRDYGGGDVASGVGSLDRCSIKDNDDDLLAAEIRQLQDWVHSEIEKRTRLLQQRHYAEIEAFTEQLALNDEELEAYRWRVLSMDMESKRLQDYIEGLEGDLSKYREESIKLEALLVHKEEETKYLMEQLNVNMRRLGTTSRPPAAGSATLDVQAPASEARAMIKREASERWREWGPTSDEDPLPQEDNLNLQGDDVVPIDGEKQRKPESPSTDHQRAPREVAEEEKEVSVDSGCDKLQHNLTPSQVADDTGKAQGAWQGEDSPWKVDLNALGVSYKIRRLKQQLLVLEKLTGSQQAGEKPAQNEGQFGGFLSVISLLNKQIMRYQSLEEKTDSLCKKMRENDREETTALDAFLEEAFHLQRHIVSTGQKLVEVQSKLAASVAGGDNGRGHRPPPGVNAAQFADVARALLREIQRGFEVRVARMIGSLEGTLASEGILHTTWK